MMSNRFRMRTSFFVFNSIIFLLSHLKYVLVGCIAFEEVGELLAEVEHRQGLLWFDRREVINIEKARGHHFALLRIEPGALHPALDRTFPLRLSLRQVALQNSISNNSTMIISFPADNESFNS